MAAGSAGTIGLAGYRIGYRVVGAGRRRVLLLNGSAFNYRQYTASLLPQLRLRLRDTAFLLFDYPGIGRSPPLPWPRPPAPDSRTRAAGEPAASGAGQGASASQAGPWRQPGIRVLADSAAGLLDLVGWPDAHLFGVSQGSLVGQALLIAHPQRVRSFCGFGNPYAGDAAMVRELGDFGRSVAALRAMTPAELDAPIAYPMVRRFLSEVLSGVIGHRTLAELGPLERLRFELIARAVAPMLVGTPLRVILALFESYCDPPAEALAFFRDGLAAAPPRPTLLLNSPSDDITPLAAARALHAALPGSQLVEIPGVSHMGPMLLPRETWPVVRRYARWLGQQPG